MKRFITILAVFAMLLSVLALGVSAEPSCQQVTIPRFTAMPTFDGVVSVEEWGEPTVHVVTDGAATVDDDTVGSNDEYGLLNTFYWFEFEDNDMAKNFYYDLWMRWDDDYFYIAAKVNDPNPFSQVDTWTGDNFQFTVDIKGPSANVVAKYPEFDYKTDPFKFAYLTPWSSKFVYSSVVSLVKGRTPTLWRAGGDWNIAKEAGGYVGATTVPNSDGVTCTNTFEVAVPWDVIAADGVDVTALNPDFVPKAGDVYGTAAIVKTTDSNVTYGWLQWGHGIGYVSDKSTQPRGTRGGAQAMTLGTDEITPESGYETAAVTTEIETEREPLVTINRTTTVVTEADTGSKTIANTAISIKDNGAVISIAVIGVAIVVAVAVIIIVTRKKKK